MSYQIGSMQASNIFNRVDGTQNPYGGNNQRDGVLSASEIGAALTQLQNSPAKYSPGGQQAGQLLQTIMTGNGGQGYYDMISSIDGQAGISRQDMQYLSGLDGNAGNLSQQDFLALKSMKQQQQQSFYPGLNLGGQPQAQAYAGPNGAYASAGTGSPQQAMPQQQQMMPPPPPPQQGQQGQQGQMMQMMMQFFQQFMGVMMQMFQQMGMGGGQQNTQFGGQQNFASAFAKV